MADLGSMKSQLATIERQGAQLEGQATAANREVEKLEEELRAAGHDPDNLEEEMSSVVKDAETALNAALAEITTLRGETQDVAI